MVNGQKIKCLADQGRPGRAAVEGAGRGHRHRVDRPVHRRHQGQGPHRRRREEGHHLGPRQERRHHHRAGRQRGQVRPGQAQHHLQRKLHDQLPGPGGPRAAEGRLRHRRRPDDHHPQLHGHAEDGRRPVEEGLEGRPHRGDQHHPLDHRRGQGRRPGDSRGEGQADRHGLPRADADGERRRPDRPHGQGDQLRGDLRGHEEGQRDVPQGHPGLHRGRGRLERLHPRRPFEHLRRRQRHRAEQASSSSS